MDGSEVSYVGTDFIAVELNKLHNSKFSFFQGGGVVELKRGGSKIPVTHENVVEYIYRFVEARMLGNHLKCLEVGHCASRIVEQQRFRVSPNSMAIKRRYACRESFRLYQALQELTSTPLLSS